MNLHVVVMICVFLIFSEEGWAVEPDCMRASTSQEIFECSNLTRRVMEREVLISKKNLLRRIKMQYINDVPRGIEYSGVVSDSQRLWRKLVDKDCRVETAEIEPGTQAYEATKNNCVVRKLKERSTYLDSLME